MRIISVLTISVLACGAALAEPRPETATYVDGNVTGVSPHTGGTLMFSDAMAMHLRTASANVTVPYESITKAELGAIRMHSHQVPMYKIWEVRRRLNETTETRYLTLAFKSDVGDDQTMTLELAKSAVPDVMATIQSHTRPGVVPADSIPPVKLTSEQILAAKPAEASSAPWWGDDYWKTTRNKDKWNQAAANNSAPNSVASANPASGQ
jgi:hypothetical protein